MTFITETFLLSNETARKLYFDFARDLPIIDYHNHLDPQAIAENKQFRNLTELWLAGDHYKWRAMRAHGIEEQFISGNASDEKKFWKWSQTVPFTLRNPLYHWTHMELKFPFGIDKLLNEESGMQIYWDANEQLAQPEFRVQGLLDQFKVELVCTTDDPVDDLHWHRKYRSETYLPTTSSPTALRQNNPPQLLPTFRPDRALAVDDPKLFREWVNALATSTGKRIKRYDQLIEALDERHQYFHDHGCRLADHGLSQIPSFTLATYDLPSIFNRLVKGGTVTPEEKDNYRYNVLLKLTQMNAKRGWTQQFHIGPIRNTNYRLGKLLGADAGVDSIGDWNHATRMAEFFDHLDSQEQLARTIVYNSNPRDNAVFSTLMGNFNFNSQPGKMQHGAAWWFLDQREGIIDHLNSISNFGLLRHFVGMLTDSRSFLSFSRHEYFRRILCDLLGQEMEGGLLPNDLNLIGGMVADICYHNARAYFQFEP